MLRYPELICAAVPELAPARGFDQRSVYHAFNVYEQPWGTHQSSSSNTGASAPG